MLLESPEHVQIRDVSQKPKIGFFSKAETSSISLVTVFEFFSFLSRIYIKITKCQIKLIHTLFNV